MAIIFRIDIVRPPEFMNFLPPQLHCRMARCAVEANARRDDQRIGHL